MEITISTKSDKALFSKPEVSNIFFKMQRNVSMSVPTYIEKQAKVMRTEMGPQVIKMWETLKGPGTVQSVDKEIAKQWIRHLKLVEDSLRSVSQKIMDNADGIKDNIKKIESRVR